MAFSSSWSSFRYVLFLFWLSGVFAACLFLFTGGFLLRRETLPQKSKCRGSGPACHAPDTPPVYEKAVILIVDALKFEFAQHSSDPEAGKQHFLNKLPVLKRLEDEGRGRLFEFMADPPTTTMQRLKGLTTGSLPTFIDASSNFGSYAIDEDNIIDQLVANGKKIVFAGDDTWEGLYPGRFERFYPFPSFDVWDLDTVDNGVTKNLFNELDKSDWDVIIGHYLGVDHAGHKFGPKHPEMARKLGEMNDVIERTLKALPDDCVLFVMGDHGMTTSGDHGGDSKDELSAALFVASNKLKPRNGDKDSSQTIQQVDFVPTFSLLMGIPIPFSNLGRIVPDLFTVDSKTELFPYLKENVEQVMNYLEAYRLRGGNLPVNQYLDLRRNFDAFKALSKKPDPSLVRGGVKLLSEAKLMCQSVWAEFDLSLMGAGVTMLLMILTLTFVMGIIPRNRLLPGIINLKFLFQQFMSCIFGALGGIALLLSAKIDPDRSLEVVVTSTLILTISVFGLNLLWKLIESLGDIFDDMVDSLTSVPVLLNIGLVISITVGLFSNSYVVDEALVISYAALSSVAIYATTLRSKKPKRIKLEHVQSNGNGTHHHGADKDDEDEPEEANDNRTQVLLAILFVMGIIRLSTVYFRCREEQAGYCLPTELHKPISTLSKDPEYKDYKNRRFSATIAAVFFSVLLPQFWLQHCGNLNGISLSVYLATYFPPFAGLSLVFYWAMQGHEVGSRLVPWQQNILAQTVIVLCLLSIFLTLIHPRLLFRMDRVRGQMPGVQDGVRDYFQFLRSNWKNHFTQAPTNGRTKINIFGLGTALSAPMILISTMLVILSMLILGDGLCPALFLAVCAAVAVVYLTTNARIVGARSLQELFTVPWTAIATWWLLESFFFYATAHQPTFPTIQWSSAFVGFSGAEFGSGDKAGALAYLIPAILVGWNTFASRIVFGISLPLLLTAPFTLWLGFPSLRREFKDNKGILSEEDMGLGEVVLVEHVEETKSQLFKLCMRYLHLQAIRLLASMLAATVLRRHLMVWKIFAPRFIFEGVGFLVSVVSVFGGFLIMGRIHNSIVSYYRKLEKNK